MPVFVQRVAEEVTPWPIRSQGRGHGVFQDFVLQENANTGERRLLHMDMEGTTILEVIPLPRGRNAERVQQRLMAAAANQAQLQEFLAPSPPRSPATPEDDEDDEDNDALGYVPRSPSGPPPPPSPPEDPSGGPPRNAIHHVHHHYFH